jgi:hypothetical protein
MDPKVDADAQVLGRGAAGEVLKAQCFGRPVAVKKIKGLITVPDEVKEEAALHVRLQHPNILRY